MTKRMRQQMTVGMLACGALALNLCGATPPPAFTDGDTVVFYGDSITHHNHYVAYLYLFYATRYPDAHIRFRNAGIGGNRTASALQRFRQDVVDAAPTRVAVLFGMNDGNQRAFDEQAFQVFQKGMTTILDRIARETAATPLLLTPTYFDYPVRQRHLTPGLSVDPGYNGVLVRFGDAIEAMAEARGCPVIDLNAPMDAMTRRLRVADPVATLSRDGVHPLPAGHFVMADTILRALAVTGTVSSCEIDAARGTVVTERCTVSNLQHTANMVAFDLRQRSLPFPHPDEARDVIDRLNFDAVLNREHLAVTGLAEGAYSLVIDGDEIGRYTAAELAGGVALAANEHTPQHRQAVEVQRLWQDWRTGVRREREFRWMEKTRGYRQSDGGYASARRGTFLISADDVVIEVAEEAWQRRFDELSAEAAETHRQLTVLEAAIQAAARPRMHHYILQKNQ